MRQYSNIITLVKNSRGCYDLDTTKSCSNGLQNNPKGCYGECYAYQIALRYGYDFKTAIRAFKNTNHLNSILKKISKIDMPFVRIGVTGDPSDNWEHTVSVATKITTCYVVIITKHWNSLTDKQLTALQQNNNVIINTSISALDNAGLLNHRLYQYNRIKNYCKSILRIVSCDFNLSNELGNKLNSVQNDLFKNDDIIDTVLRCSKSNYYVENGNINIKRVKFLRQACYASVHNDRTFFGYCKDCPEMCGVNL